jgi:hypothetical protein
MPAAAVMKGVIAGGAGRICRLHPVSLAEQGLLRVAHVVRSLSPPPPFFASVCVPGFLTYIERFKERVGLHGVSAEGNPSGGNKFRGLYNIALKSLGAAMKKAPDVRLDGVVEYGQHCPGGDDGQRGYYFMNSPGNDLESIAGQVPGPVVHQCGPADTCPGRWDGGKGGGGCLHPATCLRSHSLCGL